MRTLPVDPLAVIAPMKFIVVDLGQGLESVPNRLFLCGLQLSIAAKTAVPRYDGSSQLIALQHLSNLDSRRL